MSSQLHWKDQLHESFETVAARPGRAIGTSIGVALGVGAALATFLMASTARHQVTAEFDALLATQVRIAPASLEPGPFDDPYWGPMPEDADARLSRLAGVIDGGVVIPLSESVEIASNDLVDPQARNSTPTTVLAATAGALDASEMTVRGSRWSTWHEEHRIRIALIGSTLADRIGIDAPADGQVIYLDGVPFTYAGLITGAAREPALLNAVVVPTSVGAQLWGRWGPAPPYAIAHVQPGAGAIVAQQSALALRPDAAESLHATPPPDPRTLRQRIEGSVEAMFVAVAAIALAVGAIGIANATMISVFERRQEFALRRALGARRSHIARHVITDTGLLGALSGSIGTGLGIATTLAISAQHGWVPVVDPRAIVLGPVGGCVIGIIAGVVPAHRASRAEPATAIRGSSQPLTRTGH